MAFLVLVSVVMFVVTIMIGAARRHPHWGWLFLVALFFWPAALIWACCGGYSSDDPERYLSTRDRRELARATASAMRDEAAALRAGRDQRIREQRVAEIETRQPNMAEIEYTYRLDRLGRRGR